MTDYKPIIAINLCTRSGEDLFYIKTGYIEAIRKAGGHPIGLPLMADKEYAARMIELADGILLPGSLSDVDPKYYGDEVTPHFGEKGPERDESDFYLLEKAFDRKLPVFGICFGHQSLNVFCGGSLYQDIPHDLETKIPHYQKEPYSTPAHNVRIEQNSLMHRLFQTEELPVNSIHHQGVKTIGPSLRPTAYSPDGVIEAYEGVNGGQFLLGVQWHPERMFNQHPEQLKLFTEFIGAATQWHQKNK